MKYHGFLDDVVFLAFGVEDERTAGIDVRAGDLVRGLGLCSDVAEMPEMVTRMVVMCGVSKEVMLELDLGTSWDDMWISGE